jgi:hypothetical protein
MALTTGAIRNVAIGAAAFGLAKKLFSPSTGGKPNSTKPDVQFNGASDYRARLEVPNVYLQSSYTQGGDNYVLQNNNGVVFPYTPSISYTNDANYATTNVMHSNYAIYSYKNSAISSISVGAKFTVQNDEDALIYLATAHLLKSLTKMYFGVNDGTLAGSPPPVCRFSAYGDFMMKNVPVVVSNFTQDFPDSIDSYVTDPKNNNAAAIFGTNFVPTVSTFNLKLLPVYSRNEMSNFSLTDFRDSNTLRKGGYL